MRYFNTLTKLHNSISLKYGIEFLMIFMAISIFFLLFAQPIV